ncbi:MAG: OmpA family protein [Nodosilinea sp.]
MADSPDLPPPTANKTPSVGGSDPVSPAPVAPAPAAPAPQPRSGPRPGLHALWTLVVRLIMLGAGVSLGWLVGMLVAQVFPARSPEPPLTEIALRSSSQTGRKLQHLPQWWRGDRSVTPTEATPAPAAAAPEDLGEAPAATATAAEPPPLSEDESDRIIADLTNLRQDLATLNTRLEALETTLGTPTTGTLEDRLQRLDQRLGADAAAAGPETPAASAEPPTAEPVASTRYQEARFPLVRDRVVLPSALLFNPGSSTLTAPGQQLLDSIAPDLRRYGAATLLVGSHTDSTTAPEPASQLTLQQALAVQQYLDPQLEGSGSRWVAVGYGNSRPLTTGTDPAEQSRNQRVEIGIVPGR